MLNKESYRKHTLSSRVWLMAGTLIAASALTLYSFASGNLPLVFMDIALFLVYGTYVLSVRSMIAMSVVGTPSKKARGFFVGKVLSQATVVLSILTSSVLAICFPGSALTLKFLPYTLLGLCFGMFCIVLLSFR